jgi:hypothetical protein
MQTIEYRYLDKIAWGDGPWQSEPDKVQWQDKQTGLPCLAVRHPRHGNWCGYVGVAEGHPFFELAYDAVDSDCHGGLTYAGFCLEDDKEHGLCHVPGKGEPDHVWWLCFDCAHGDDCVPSYMHENEGFKRFRVYRELDYVRSQCRHIAQQLISVTRLRAP